MTNPMTTASSMFAFRGSLFQLMSLLVLLAPAMTSCNAATLPQNCADIHEAASRHSGVYTIYPIGPTSAIQVGLSLPWPWPWRHKQWDLPRWQAWETCCSCRFLNKCLCRSIVTWTLTEDGGQWVFPLLMFSWMWLNTCAKVQVSSTHVDVRPMWSDTSFVTLPVNLTLLRCSRGGWMALWISTDPGITTR